MIVWLTLVVASGWHLWRRLSWVWGRAQLLEGTLADVEASLAAATDVTAPDPGTAGPQPPATQLAIFRNPADVAAERVRVREALNSERAARRRASLPGWARRVDSA